MKTTETTFKKTFSFVDADRNKITLTAEITHRNGYPEFTISGDMGNSGGQIVDHIKPANDPQKQIIEIWDSWHLNGMTAGTEKQNKALKKAGITDYEEAVKYLQTIDRETGERITEQKRDEVLQAVNEYPLDGFRSAPALSLDFGVSFTKAEAQKAKDGHGKEILLSKLFAWSLWFDDYNGGMHQYGAAWIRKTLPEDFQEQLETVISDIVDAEDDRKGEPLTDMNEADLLQLIEEETNFEDRDAELCAALVRMFDLSEDDLQDIEIDDTRATVQGIEYLAGDDDEMDELWEQDLDNYLEECVLSELHGDAQRYFDREAWKRDARMDGRAHSLNHYDGGEESVSINGTYYYAYRQ